MYRKHRSDGNQEAIVKAFEDLGCSVWKIGRPTDLLIGHSGINWLVEVKTKRGKRTPAQEKFSKEWQGSHSVVRDTSGAVLVVKMIRERRFREDMEVLP